VPIAERTGITRFDDSVRLLGSTFLEIMLEPVEHGIEKRWKVVGSRNISREYFFLTIKLRHDRAAARVDDKLPYRQPIA